MKLKSITLWSIFFLFLSAPGKAQKHPMTENSNKQLIKKAFNKWASGTGNFFDLLADNVHWTVAGSSPVSGVYKSRELFLEKAVQPINNKLSIR